MRITVSAVHATPTSLPSSSSTPNVPRHTRGESARLYRLTYSAGGEHIPAAALANLLQYDREDAAAAHIVSNARLKLFEGSFSLDSPSVDVAATRAASPPPLYGRSQRRSRIHSERVLAKHTSKWRIDDAIANIARYEEEEPVDPTNCFFKCRHPRIIESSSQLSSSSASSSTPVSSSTSTSASSSSDEVTINACGRKAHTRCLQERIDERERGHK